MTDQERHGRELEEDHDLLTFNESAARLRQEIGDARATLAELGENAAQAPAVRRRLEMLLASQELIEAQALQNADGHRFADFRPPGRD